MNYQRRPRMECGSLLPLSRRKLASVRAKRFSSGTRIGIL
jgi:hypothetical protein